MSWRCADAEDDKAILAASGAAALIILTVAFTGSTDESSAYSWDTISRGDIRETVQGSAALVAARRALERLTVAHKREEESFKRTESLYRQGLLSEEAYRDARYTMESAQISAASAEANVRPCRSGAISFPPICGWRARWLSSDRA